MKISINDQVNHWSDVCDIAKMASLICKKFSISEEKVLVTLDELRQASNSIKSFSEILYVEPKKVHLDFPPEFKDYEQGSKCACTFSIMTDIGNHTIVCFLAIIGVPSLESTNSYTLVAESILFGNELISIDGEIIEQSVIDEKFDDFEEKLQKRELKIIRMPFLDNFETN